MNKELKNYFYIIIGALTAAIGINTFFVPNDLVPGGITGIGIIIRYFTEKYWHFAFPISISNIVLNIPLFLAAYKKFGGRYIRRSLIASALFSAALQITIILPEYKGDSMLAAIFGGIMMGSGIGIILNGSATTGGTETAAHLLHNSNDRLSVSNYIFIIDSIIVAAGFFAFGAETAMFSVISIFTAAKCISMVSSGSTMDKAAIVVSEKYAEIAKEIREGLGREITVINKCSSDKLVKNNCTNTLICVFSQKETVQLKEIIKSIDSFAFIILFDIKDVYGGGFKKL